MLFKSGTEAGAGDGDFLFLTTCPGLDPFVDGPVGLRFFRLGSVGFMKLRRVKILLILIPNKEKEKSH